MDFCIVTPSYAADFERCALLARSLSSVSPPLTHYIIVGRRNLKLFEKLRGRNTEIVAEADILPLRLWKVGSFRNESVLLSWRTLPVRGWLLQQLLKIAVARHVPEDVILYVDSDVAFIRPFDCRILLRDGWLMLYRDPNAIRLDMSPAREWVRTAHDLFGLPAPTFPSHTYINSLVAWRRENVLRLCDALEANRNAPWVRTLANSWHCSEYILYGIFCERLLEERAGHFCAFETSATTTGAGFRCRMSS